MCCFTRPVERVEQTRIYARAEGARQLVVYELKLVAAGDLAMVLPIPVADASAEDAISFVDLSSSPAFFSALDYAFIQLEDEDLAADAQPSRRGASKALAVHQVGAFEASFVPRATDFDRLDPRFSLPSSLWAEVPAVAGFGFVVFKMRESAEPRGLFSRVLGSQSTPRTFHPMAFWFPRRDRARVFFPTLHVHDGRMHPHASFDHVLYAQTERAAPDWETSPRAFMEGMGGVGRGLLRVGSGQRRVLRGTLPNADVWIAG